METCSSLFPVASGWGQGTHASCMHLRLGLGLMVCLVVSGVGLPAALRSAALCAVSLLLSVIPADWLGTD